MNTSGSRIFILLSRNVTLFRIAHLIFVRAFNSHLSISIALHCAFAIAYNSMDCYISTNTFINGYTSTSMTFSSLVSFCIVYAFTKCCSTTSSSSDSSMNIEPTNVTPCPICFFAHQCLLLPCKNSTTNVPIISIS